MGDIYQFVDIVSKNTSKEDEKSRLLKAKAEELKKFIETELVIAKGFYGNEKSGK